MEFIKKTHVIRTLARQAARKAGLDKHMVVFVGERVVELSRDGTGVNPPTVESVRRLIEREISSVRES